MEVPLCSSFSMMSNVLAVQILIILPLNSSCVGSKYAVPVGSVRIDFESLPNDHLVAGELPPGLEDSDDQMVRLNDTLVSIVDLFVPSE